MTSVCPKCGSKAIVRFSSLRYKKCADCGYKEVWELKEGQKSTLTNEVGETKNET